jgi:hypothetical protein
VIDHIIQLDSDDEKYTALISEPWFVDNQYPIEYNDESMLRFFEFMIDDSKSRKPVATSLLKNYAHRILLLKYKVTGALHHRLGVSITS